MSWVWRTSFIWLMSIFVGLFFWNCEPGDALKVEPQKKTDTGTMVGGPKDFAYGISIGRINWPVSLIKDSSVTLSFVVLDTAGTRVYPGARVQIVVLDTNTAEVRDTNSAVVSTWQASTQGKISIQLKSKAVGQATLQFNVLTSKNLIAYTETFSIRITTPQEAPKITKRLKLEVLSPVINADGNSKSVLRVTVKDPENHPLVNVPVNFSATGGVVVASAMTNEEGIAEGWIRSERVNDTVTVRASLSDGGQTLSETQTVVFSGIKIRINAHMDVAKVGERDTITFELRDGADGLLTNDTLYLELTGASGWENTNIQKKHVVTNALGQYTTWVVSSVAGNIKIRVLGLGASGDASITYTNNSIFVTATDTTLIGNGTDTSQITVRLQDGSNQPISGATLLWSTSFGDLTSSPISTSASDGRARITFRAPSGVGEAVITVVASKADQLIAMGSVRVRVLPIKPFRLELGISPDNIPVNVGQSTLTARAFDVHGDIINDLLVGFKIVKSAGGGDEKITNPTVITQQGEAKTFLKAGNVVSEYLSVRVTAIALSIVGKDTSILASSDTLGLTISGPPASVSLGANILKGMNPNDGTFELPIAAVVKDVNGNLVADGTPVNFGLVPAAYYPYLSDADQWRGPIADGVSVTYGFVGMSTHPYYQVETFVKQATLIWSDYNNNLRLDDGETGMGGKPYRGEDINGDGAINIPPETYYDLNGNGWWESGNCPVNYTTLLDCDFAEPFVTTQVVGNDTLPIWADYNKNGFWDKRESFTDNNKNGLCDCVGGRDSTGTPFDYEFNYAGGKTSGEPPKPYGSGGGLKASIVTNGGKASQRIVYPQTDANKVKVKVSAEANGIRDELLVILPIISDEGN